MDTITRTPAEQADFDARVAAAAKAKRDEAEREEVEAAAAAKHEEDMAAIEAEREAAEKTAVDRQAEADRHAKRAAHPHTRLTGLQTQMAARNLDVNARIGMLTSVVAQLLVIIKEHTPAPEDDDGEGRIEQQPAEGPDGQVSKPV
jgi:hypothetical protein